MIGQVYEMECQGYHYVGVHCGDIIKDNYYGSGIAWLNVVNKYGKDNVRRTILSYFHSKDERDNLEKFYIKECKNTYGKLCLNIADGGQGGNLGDEVNKKISQKVSGKGNGMYGKKLTKEQKEKMSNKLKGHPNYNLGGYHHTSEAKAKISEKHKGLGHPDETKQKLREYRQNQVNLNLRSAIGKHWYYNPKTNEENMLFEKDVPVGWIRGRIKQSTKGKIYYTNGIEDILLDENEPIPNGFVKGRRTKQIYSEERNKKISDKLKGKSKSETTKQKLSQSLKGRNWYNNGTIQSLLFECPKGWKKGKIK